MKKITKDAVRAFLNRKKFKRSNTEVVIPIPNETHEGNPSAIMYLHNNPIAFILDNCLTITSCGWETNTTKERLNGLPGVHIQKKNLQWYLNGKEWDGALTKV